MNGTFLDFTRGLASVLTGSGNIYQTDMTALRE
jgi:hypothetical protein